MLLLIVLVVKWETAEYFDNMLLKLFIVGITIFLILVTEVDLLLEFEWDDDWTFKFLFILFFSFETFFDW